MTILVIYIIGFCITWISAAVYWINRNGDDLSECIVGGIWGAMVAILWPFIWLGIFVGMVAKSINWGINGRY